MILFKQFQQHILSVLVRNIPHHNSGPTVNFHSLEVNYISPGLFIADSASVSHWRCLRHIVVVILGWQRHHRHGHGGLHVGRGRCIVRSVSGRNRIRTMLSFFLSDDSHTPVHDSCNLLIIFLTVRRFLSALLLLSFDLRLNVFFSLVLKEKERVIEGVLTVGDNFSPVFTGNFQSCKGIRTLCQRILNMRTRVSIHSFFFFEWSRVRSFEGGRVGGDETCEMVVVKSDEFFVLGKGWAITRLLTMGGAAPLFHLNNTI